LIFLGGFGAGMDPFSSMFGGGGGIGKFLMIESA
jgi:hypothetical protein